MPTPALPSGTVAMVLRDYQDGDRVVDVAKRYGLSDSYVYQLAKKHGVRKRVVGLSDDDLNRASGMVLDFIEQVARRGDEMPGNRKVGDQLGYSAASVALAVRDLERRKMIRVEADHLSRRIVVLRTGEKTAGGPPVAGDRTSIMEPRQVRPSPCTYCGARPDACSCGRTPW